MSSKRKVIGLDGIWQYNLDCDDQGRDTGYYAVDFQRSSWRDIEIPNNWYLTDIGDYCGVVWFAREFSIEKESAGGYVTLNFDAVDYTAEVWLNGVFLGSHEGFFAPFCFRVDSLLKEKNLLIVRVDSPLDPTEYVPVDELRPTPLSRDYKRHFPEALEIIKGGLINHKHRPGGATKFGQKGNTGGIWQDVKLVCRGPVGIESIKIYPKLVKEYTDPSLEPKSYADTDSLSALVSFDMDLYNSLPETVSVKTEITVEGDNFDSPKPPIKATREFVLPPGTSTVRIVKTIENPELWWTWDYGKPNLYIADVALRYSEELSDNMSARFGICEITHDESSRQWFLNERRIFIRGMRYHASQWMSEMNRKRYLEDLQMMLDCSINSIRIGSHVEKPELYDLCDELGILVWHVFPLHYCVSDSDSLIERATVMMKEMVRMLFNHPSTMAYSCFKEPEVYPIANKRKKPNNYGRLCQMMYEAAREIDPIRWVHKGDYREGVQNVTIGNSRPWNMDISSVELKPMIVEYGAAVVPGLESLKEMMSEKDIWPPNWDEWALRANSYDCTVPNTGINDIGDSIDELIEKSQSYMESNTKDVVEYLRQRKYNPVTTLYHYYWSESYPGFGTGLVDYFRRPNRGFYAYKRANTPVLVSLEWLQQPRIVGKEKKYLPGEEFRARIWIVNDLYRDFNRATLDWSLSNSEGTRVLERSFLVDIASDSAAVFHRINWRISNSTAQKYLVQMKLTAVDGDVLSENDFEFTVAQL